MAGRTIKVGTRCRVSIRKNDFGEYEVNSYVGPNRIAQAFETDLVSARRTQQAEAKWLREGRYAHICEGGTTMNGARRRRRR